jgi:acyl-CoA synthetase (AMP-forming)/AMP-acid ligase II
VTVRILDPESDATLADGRFGEIEISGPCVGRPFDAASATLDGRVRTGDLGFLADGVLVVTGRKKDLIILKGQNLFPADVERAALQASPLVVPGGVAAIGAARDGSEALVLIVEIQNAAIDEIELSALRRRLNEVIAIATGHAPSEIVPVQFGSLPRTSSGKVQRNRVRDQFIAGELRPL